MNSKQIYKQHAIVPSKKKMGAVISLIALGGYIAGSSLFSGWLMKSYTPIIGEVYSCLLAIFGILITLPLLFSFVLKVTQDNKQ